MKTRFFCLMLCVLMLVGILTSCYVDTSETTDSKKTETEESTLTDSDNDNLSMGEKMALESAKNYLRTMGFSKKGLIDQLEYEGYTTSEATYAVNHCGANWKEQAVRVAKNYLDTMPFSKQELIRQLEYEGFTSEEATYGVEVAYK